EREREREREREMGMWIEDMKNLWNVRANLIQESIYKNLCFGEMETAERERERERERDHSAFSREISCVQRSYSCA
ncbi:hypothetical protein, partial [Enterobacter cloacae complex sp. GF14B]|uniref:hypothetical protein n=1 Tax=Enterobacter cloacae complex sp. GF14B TaxID=2511982 RepID=UPI0010259FDD